MRQSGWPSTPPYQHGRSPSCSRGTMRDASAKGAGPRSRWRTFPGRAAGMQELSANAHQRMERTWRPADSPKILAATGKQVLGTSPGTPESPRGLVADAHWTRDGRPRHPAVGNACACRPLPLWDDGHPVTANPLRAPEGRHLLPAEAKPVLDDPNRPQNRDPPVCRRCRTLRRGQLRAGIQRLRVGPDIREGRSSERRRDSRLSAVVEGSQ